MERRIHILLADDESQVATTIRLVLGTETYTLDLVSDGTQALNRIKEQPDYYDVLITDDFMPNLRGIELVRRLRALKFRGKIVVLSAYLSQDLSVAYRALAVDKLLEKPFDNHALRDAIDEVCGSLLINPAKRIEGAA